MTTLQPNESISNDAFGAEPWKQRNIDTRDQIKNTYIATKRAFDKIKADLKQAETAFKYAIEEGLFDEHINHNEYEQTGLRQITLEGLVAKESPGRVTYTQKSYSEALQQQMQLEREQEIAKPTVGAPFFSFKLND